MRCYGHMAHGTSPLYTSVRSLRDLHSLGPSALGCVNRVETCTSVYNLYIHREGLVDNYFLALCFHGYNKHVFSPQEPYECLPLPSGTV